MYDNIIVPDVWFQFPARNSVCSDIACPPEGVRYIVVSIPRSEFCLFGLPSRANRIYVNRKVSIPRSEFCLFGHETPEPPPPDLPVCFNSPLGILFVRT